MVIETFLCKIDICYAKKRYYDWKPETVLDKFLTDLYNFEDTLCFCYEDWNPSLQIINFIHEYNALPVETVSIKGSFIIETPFIDGVSSNFKYEKFKELLEKYFEQDVKIEYWLPEEHF